MTATLSPAADTVTVWNIDPTHTTVQFSVRHLMISTVKGHFGDVKGTLRLDAADPTASTVEVEIAAASIDTRVEQRDQHLRSADFFDAETFPALRFVATGVEGDTNGTFSVAGELTIRGVTRPIVLEVENEGRARDPWGNARVVFSAKGKFLRSDFGLNWNQTLEAGGVLVSDEVKLAIDVQFVQAAA